MLKCDFILLKFEVPLIELKRDYEIEIEGLTNEQKIDIKYEEEKKLIYNPFFKSSSIYSDAII